MLSRRRYFLGLVALALGLFLLKTFLLPSSSSSISRASSPLGVALRTSPAWRATGRMNSETEAEGGSRERTRSLVRLPPDTRYIARPPMTVDIPPAPGRKVIVFLNKPDWLFDFDPRFEHIFDTCPYTCTLSQELGLLSKADAVWVDVGRLNNPSPPPGRPPNQMWVAYNIESPIHFLGYAHNPAWRNVFNWTFSYRTDSDFFRPYGDFKVKEKLPEPGKNYTQIARNKTKPIAWFVSNCGTPSRRRQYVEQLRKYIDVDIYGQCGMNTCPGLATPKCFTMINDTYFFYLAFENSYCGDYVTEKLFKMYRNVNVIPIVRGAVNYSNYLPPNTFINTADFPSPRHLAERLHALMKGERVGGSVGGQGSSVGGQGSSVGGQVSGLDQSSARGQNSGGDRGSSGGGQSSSGSGGSGMTYAEMLETKDHFYTSFTSWVKPNLLPFCELCRALQQSPLPRKVYPDIMAWHNSKKCRSPTDL